MAGCSVNQGAGCLAYASFADHYWIIFGAPSENLDHAPDPPIPTDDAIQLTHPGQLRQTTAVPG